MGVQEYNKVHNEETGLVQLVIAMYECATSQVSEWQIE